MDVIAWLERPQRKRRDMEQTVGRKRPPLEPFAEKMPSSSKGTQHREDIFREWTVSFLTVEACNRKWNVSCLAVPKSTLREVGLRFVCSIQLAVSAGKGYFCFSKLGACEQ